MARERAAGSGITMNLRIGAVFIDFIHQTATRDGHSIAISQKEFAMLRLLASNSTASP